MIGTIIVALSISCMQLMPSFSESPEEWAGLGVALACIAAIALVSVIPAMLLVFRLRSAALAIAMLVVYAAAGVFSVFALIVVFSTTLILAGWLWDIFAFTLVFGSFGVFLGLGLKAARDMGFTLVRGRGHP
jgi:hypothetical protein